MTRYYQHSMNDYIKTQHLPTLTYEGDLPDGGVICCCGFCHEEIHITGGVEECPECGKDLIFPRADW